MLLCGSFLLVSFIFSNILINSMMNNFIKKNQKNISKWYYLFLKSG